MNPFTQNVIEDYITKQVVSNKLLVRCPVGQVIDVIYDMRTDSPTYNKVVKVPLGGEFKEDLSLSQRVLTWVFC